ncbi:pilus assembly protein [Marilutibacter alkalisoli]|uniref:Pilus assembly protein n=1 Tax=Marilutibacter alkalisoli TaxID=2591633 RepID=A0A514BX81_9GAMM|nr:pilus assembly protein [Lysobacter alkalisoli]QDH71599.1 pilus assembly protein [Lysobacter alkalisoli]
MELKQRRFGTRQRGQGMTEYIIIVALIAIAAITVVSFFGGTVRNQVAGMAQELSGTSASSSIGQAKQNAQKAANDAKQERNMGSYENQVSD